LSNDRGGPFRGSSVYQRDNALRNIPAGALFFHKYVAQVVTSTRQSLISSGSMVELSTAILRFGATRKSHCGPCCGRLNKLKEVNLSYRIVYELRVKCSDAEGLATYPSGTGVEPGDFVTLVCPVCGETHGVEVTETWRIG
jgi:hypothetical protein